MINISERAIMSKLNAYKKTSAGKQKVREFMNDCRKNGVGKTAGGGKIVTEDDMYLAADKLISILKMNAMDANTPESVMDILDNIMISKPYTMSNGETQVFLYFPNDMLHRPSLQPENYEGVDNIIALINNGYHARSTISGIWESHDGIFIDSKKDREGSYFIQQSIRDFNGNYGSDYNVHAVASDEYK